MSTGRIAKWVFVGIINEYLTTRYFIDTDTDFMIPVPVNKFSKLLKFSCIYVYKSLMSKKILSFLDVYLDFSLF